MTPDEMLTLLLRIEWQGSETYYVCPMCHASQMHGHSKKCTLKHAIEALSATAGDVA